MNKLHFEQFLKYTIFMCVYCLRSTVQKASSSPTDINRFIRTHTSNAYENCTLNNLELFWLF